MGKGAVRNPSPNSRTVDPATPDLKTSLLKRKLREKSSRNATIRPRAVTPRSPLSHPTAILNRQSFTNSIETFFGLSAPHFFLAFCIYTLFAFPEWSTRWFLSGIPLLCFLILIGAQPSDLLDTAPSQRLPHVAVVILVHLILSTSWLAYYLLAILTWPVVVVLSIANSVILQGLFRRFIKRIGRDLHYFQDKIACFDLPALDIDVHILGMMVIEGATFTLSTLTIEAHSIEVALKVDDGLEICFRTEKAVARLGRSVEIGDVYITLKTEMDTGPGSTFATRRCNTVDMMGEIGRQPEHLHPRSLGDAIEQVKDVTDTQFLDEDEEAAIQAYRARVQHIHDNTTIHTTRKRLICSTGEKYNKFTAKEKKAMLASALQTATSITHPPTWSIAVSHLKARTPAWLHEFNNRFPLAQRTLLNIIAHLHPVKCNAVIGNITGRFASGMLERAVFKHYKAENREISKLASRVQTWLETGNFVVQFSKINGEAQVPTIRGYDIVAAIKTSTVQVFKVLVSSETTDPLLDDDDAVSVDSAASVASSHSGKSGVSVTIKDKAGIKLEEDKGISEVARINGVSTRVEVPSLLLPHHEYLFPPPPGIDKKGKGSPRGLEKVASDLAVHPHEDDRLEDDDLSDDFDGRHAAALPCENGERRDEVVVLATILASLPAQFNSTILHFATALLKASKLIEIEKGVNGAPPSLSLDEEDSESPFPRSRSLSRMGTKISASMKRTVTGAVDDAWIARLVGRLMGKIEGLKGEIGYKMPISVDLHPRRKVGLGPKGTAVDYGLFGREEIRALWPEGNPYRRNC
ncbi:hypothetical protein ABW21_db0207518 [Orbilia brochopaga]|nr:hypothetical protein ABW21_db0207518 [Drechslerella brochopaga]